MDRTGHELQIWTVSDITGAVRDALEVPEFQSLWVQGEISNLRRPASGHVYFTLKDASASLRCVLFKGDAARIPFRLTEGTDVLLHGRIGVYERAGEYQLYVRGAEPAGLGSMHLALEELRRRLEEEGLFDPARKRSLPRYPRNIGVVTSRSGAALRDIVQVARRRNRGVNLLLAHASVQGETAPGELIDALHRINRSDVEAVIIGRGGGSAEDLWAFNDETLVRTVAEMDIPVVSAVGHETDVTLVDLVADSRAPTPSAAAELLVTEARVMARELMGIAQRLSRSLEYMLQSASARLRAALYARVFRHPEDLIRDRQQAMDRSTERLYRACRNTIRDSRNRLNTASAQIRVLNPLRALDRGFALVMDREGRVVEDSRDLEIGARLHLRFARGRARAQVTETWDEEGDAP